MNYWKNLWKSLWKCFERKFGGSPEGTLLKVIIRERLNIVGLIDKNKQEL